MRPVLTLLFSSLIWLQACSSSGTPSSDAQNSGNTDSTTEAGSSDGATDNSDASTDDGSGTDSSETDGGGADGTDTDGSVTSGDSTTDNSDTDAGQGDSCGTDHPLVGRSAEFSNLFHDVAGRVTVLDNCTLQVTDFVYDGGGPDVAFYAYTDGDYFHPDAVRIGPMLHGRAYSNETITLPLPEGTSLDNFDSISVWCFAFGLSFGDAYLYM